MKLATIETISDEQPRHDAFYHPDPEINAEVSAEANESERLDLLAGYPPRKWACPQCSAKHSRGFFEVVGVHRCLNCGYAGEGGVMS